MSRLWSMLAGIVLVICIGFAVVFGALAIVVHPGYLIFVAMDFLAAWALWTTPWPR